MNRTFLLSLDSTKNIKYSEFDQSELHYDQNFRKTKVYIHFLQQSNAFTDDYLSSYRANLTTLCYWLGDYSLGDIHMKSPTFHWFLNQLKNNKDQNPKIIENCQEFLLWAKSIYANEFTTTTLQWIHLFANPYVSDEICKLSFDHLDYRCDCKDIKTN